MTNTFVSDLFFNLDNSECEKPREQGQFAGYDDDALLKQAEWFCDTLGRLGVDAGSPADIVADFLARL